MKQKRGIYILPSTLTTLGLFAGFYALIAAVQNNFEHAAWAIIMAVVFDILDGRVARLLNAESKFGAEYDSLCDMVSFGVAPALLVYLWALPSMGNVGGVAAFFITACSALRLARFNTQAAHDDKRYFQGLPTPATAIFISSAVIMYEQYNIQPIAIVWTCLSIALAYLMVSQVRFFAGKDMDIKKPRGFKVLLLILAILGLIASYPAIVLFIGTLLYCVHGPLLSMYQRQKILRTRLKNRRTQPNTDSETNHD